MVPTSERDLSAESSGRIGIFDIVRGAAVISMVLFHLCYDLAFIGRVSLPWFSSPLLDVWRSSISWTFLFVAGCMCPLSRSNLRRALQYGAVALLIWVVTSIASVDTAISFGIIYCMAACTLVAWALGRIGTLPSGPVAAVVLFVVFIALLNVRGGVVGVGPLALELPEALYETPWLSWLGFPGPGFSSGDYYPCSPTSSSTLPVRRWAPGGHREATPRGRARCAARCSPGSGVMRSPSTSRTSLCFC